MQVVKLELRGYHAALELDPQANGRRSAAELRRGEFARLLHIPKEVAVTWANLEQVIESEVAVLRALLGGRPIWSHSLCDRLRSFCQGGHLPSRGAELPEDLGAAFLCEHFLPPDALDHLCGRGRAQDSRQAHVWVYYYEDPELALLHLVSHPAFGAGIGSDLQAARVALCVLSSMGFRSAGHGRFAVVLLSWHTTSSGVLDVFEDTIPLGPDLAKAADLARREPHER
ncbi:unnamed protein product [Effrenium voratum]|nr:unnamed protein product [Effrenium voratum]